MLDFQATDAVGMQVQSSWKFDRVADEFRGSCLRTPEEGDSLTLTRADFNVARRDTCESVPIISAIRPTEAEERCQG